MTKMNRLKTISAAAIVALTMLSCAGVNAYQKGKVAEKTQDWDQAVAEYQKAHDLDPDNIRFKMQLQHAKLEASRVHFEKGKSLRAAANGAVGADQYRLAQLAASELEMTVRLDPSNQFAAVEFSKVAQIIQDMQHAADRNSIDEMKKRVKANVGKVQPPKLNPASDQPISLSFPRETPVKDIYKALGNAFGINILFDQAVKDDRIAIELKDVTAQQALERVFQAANHFYKVLDEHTIIVVPDNPQARRDYEDLVIRTFYLSNGDAEQVTNVVRTMIEARNVFPLKALNAITIRDTADKVLIAEKIIEANDKAKSEVVVDVELLQLDINKARTIGAQLSAYQTQAGLVGPDGKAIGALNLDQLRSLSSNFENRTVGTHADGTPRIFPGSAGVLNFTIPTLLFDFMKNASNSELLANPELRISEGEKATLHIGSRVPVPVSTFNSITTGTSGGAVAPVTSYQYQDVGIKVSIEPRVHHNREVTLKLTVEVSNLAGNAPGSNPPQPIISTRTIESTIRLKDGETNFLAGLIQHTDNTTTAKLPFLGDIPIIGRLVTHEDKQQSSTDLVLTMTPHIIRIPDITDDDMAPMWVGTQNNLTFRGVSPRIESHTSGDPFVSNLPPAGARYQQPPRQLATDGEPGNYIVPDESGTAPVKPPSGSGPNDLFHAPVNPNPPSPQVAPPEPPGSASNKGGASAAPVLLGTPKPQSQSQSSVSADEPTVAQLRLVPRMAPQPTSLSIKPGEEKIWSVIGMDLDGLNTSRITLHYDPKALEISEVMFGPALNIDPKTPPIAKIDRNAGTITIASSNGKDLTFGSGGDVVMLRVYGGLTGETFLVMDNPDFHNAGGEAVEAAVAGGRAKIQ
jgi:general secretion pathway protein D